MTYATADPTTGLPRLTGLAPTMGGAFLAGPVQQPGARIDALQSSSQIPHIVHAGGEVKRDLTAPGEKSLRIFTKESLLSEDSEHLRFQ